MKASVLQSRVNLSATFDTRWLSYETKPDGIKIHNKRYFNIMLSNAVVKNHSRADFMGEFVRLLKRSGADLVVLPAVVPAIETEHKMAVAESKHIELGKIVNAPDITDIQLEKLQEKPEHTQAERSIMTRKYLRNVYKYDGPINELYADMYHKDSFACLMKRW